MVRDSGLITFYADCAETGRPLILEDFPYYGRPALESAPASGTPQTRLYQVRAVRVGPDRISVTWRDVTDSEEAAARTARTATHYRLLAENSTDVVARFRDGKILWISPSVEAAFGQPPTYWIGREVSGLVPADDLPVLAELLDETTRGGDPVRRLRVYGADGVEHWVDVHAKTFYDVSGDPDGRIASLRVVDAEVLARTDADAARQDSAEVEDRYRLLMETSPVATNMLSLEGRFVVVNQAMCDLLGYDTATLLTLTWQDVAAPESCRTDLEMFAELRDSQRVSYRAIGGFTHADGHRIWGDVSLSCMRDRQGRAENLVAQIVDVTDAVLARESIGRYRRLMENSSVGMSLNAPDGRFIEVNNALCDMVAMDAETLLRRTWRDLTPERYLHDDLANVDAMTAGRIDSFRSTREVIRADGGLLWGDLSVGCLRSTDGDVEYMVGQVIDVTDRVALRLQLQTELDSAADYIRSILPKELHGRVEASARYLPSSRLSGDCFDFRWIDDDHFMVYVIDVSGHGVEAALVSVSLHDVLSPGSLPTEMLFAPERVLTELNRRFMMEHHNHHYATIWYGIYQPSTGTLAYAGAGHPPALLFVPGVASPVRLWPQARPVGMFEDTAFVEERVAVPAGSRMLLYSDGAFDFPLPGGGQFGLVEFVHVCAALSESAEWGIDELLGTLIGLSAGGEFKDDCSVIRLAFR